MSPPVYLDHNATTPLDPRVLDAMLPFFKEDFGNAGSGHWHGRRAQDAVETARAQVAALVGAQPDEVIFTSGATESDNLALRGVGERLLLGGPLKRTRLVTSMIEHKAVLDPIKALEKKGFVPVLLRPDSGGRVHPDALRAAVDDDTALVSLMLANNEIGSVHDVAALARVAHDAGARFHCDATQGLGAVPFHVHDMGIALASFTAHKLYGPKGTGALVVNKALGVQLHPLVTGGGQERGLRPGTLNVPGIVGFGEACALAREHGQADAQRIARLRDRLLAGLTAMIPQHHINGTLDARLPGNLSIAFDLADSREVRKRLDPHLSISAGSACSTANLEPSHVLRGIGVGHDRAMATLRFCVGRHTTDADIDVALRVVPEAIAAVRATSPAWA